MRGSDLHWMDRTNESLIVRTLPNIRKKLGELKMLPSGTDLAKQKAEELRAEVDKAIESLRTIKLGLEEE